MAYSRIVYYPIRIVEGDVPGWFYVDGHLGPGCYRRIDLAGMNWRLDDFGKIGMYELYEAQPERRGHIIPPEVGKVWYVGVAGEYPYEDVVFSVDHPGLFPDDMRHWKSDVPYCPPRGLFAPNSLEAAINFQKINRLEWAGRVISKQRKGTILHVTFHHHDNGKYSRRPVRSARRLRSQCRRQPGDKGRVGRSTKSHRPLMLTA